MCDPLTIAGIALTAGSVAANSMASSKVNDARTGAMTAERIRQQGLDQKAEALNAKDQAAYKSFDQDQGQKAKDLTAYFQGNQVPQQPPPTELPPTSSNVVTQEDAKQTGKAKAYSTQQANALGTLRSFGDVLGQDSRLQARDAGAIGQIGDFKQGSSNVLNYELDAANHAGDKMKTMADLFGGFGNIGLNAGLKGSFGGAAANPSVPIAAPTATVGITKGPVTAGNLRTLSLY